jgi:hypothetical protein
MGYKQRENPADFLEVVALTFPNIICDSVNDPRELRDALSSLNRRFRFAVLETNFFKKIVAKNGFFFQPYRLRFRNNQILNIIESVVDFEPASGVCAFNVASKTIN